MTPITPDRRVRWPHILGFVLGLIPLAVILHHNHFDTCSPIRWEDCSRG